MEVTRCFGATHSLYHDYHDHEWGVELRGDDVIFEQIVLEGFQSGLSWLTILKKRPAFRAAFDNFSIEKVATYDESDVERLMQDAGIIRNLRKIRAAITNAKAAYALQQAGGSLDTLVWSHVPDVRDAVPVDWEAVPAKSPESSALAKDLKKHGFVFVGPTTMYAMMQSIGMVYDHLAHCHVRTSA